MEIAPFIHLADKVLCRDILRIGLRPDAFLTDRLMQRPWYRIKPPCEVMHRQPVDGLYTNG